MDSFINRENLRRDILDYAVCAGNPIWLARHKALEVIDNIPEGIVRCRDCRWEQECKIAQRLGADGYCSEGERNDQQKF